MAGHVGTSHLDDVSEGPMKMNLLDAIRAQRPALAEAVGPGLMTAGHYQNELGDWIREHKPRIIVETGVQNGMSSDRILTALDDIGNGELYSVDPNPAEGLFEVVHPKWYPFRALSIDVLCSIYRKTGPWDVFLHDSDHEIYCQTFEYELAWSFVRPGGYIMSDDSTWGDPPHGAWVRFCERHHATPFMIGHACAAVQKLVPDISSNAAWSLSEIAVSNALNHAVVVAQCELADWNARRP